MASITSRAVERSGRPAAVLLLVGASAAMIAAATIERGNQPYTHNFLTPEDQAVALAFFSVPVLGTALLGLRPRHRTGWLMLTAGSAFALAAFIHALAVRLLLAFDLLAHPTQPC